MRSADIPGPPISYEDWVKHHDTLSDEDRRLILADIAAMHHRPVLSVVMPAYNTSEHLLREAIASVQAQLYPYWELCVADDASPSPSVASVLKQAAHAECRIRWMRRDNNGHISAATNSALTLASGEFVILMDHDDLLPIHALYEVAAELARHPTADVIYSDEDKVDLDGRRFDPYFKPAWSPELLTGHNVVSHMGVYRRSLLEEIGGLREGFEGSQDWDLALRATAATTPDKIRHIPAILYHWRWDSNAPSFSQSWLDRCVIAGRRAVRDWLDSEGATGAELQPARLIPGWTHIAYGLPDPVPEVSLVVLDASSKHRGEWITGTAWPADKLDIIIGEPSTQLQGKPPVRGTNLSARVNRAVTEARGSVVVVLLAALEPMEPGWLHELVGLVSRHEIGVAGVKVVDGMGVVQHAGVLLEEDAAIILRQTSWEDPGYFGQFALARGLSAVAGGCIAMRREVWDEVGGLDQTLDGTAADVDLCQRVLDRGYRVVWTPAAVLRVRGGAELPGDVQVSRSRQADKFQNPNVWLEPTRYRVPCASRRRKPWRVWPHE